MDWVRWLALAGVLVAVSSLWVLRTLTRRGASSLSLREQLSRWWRERGRSAAWFLLLGVLVAIGLAAVGVSIIGFGLSAFSRATFGASGILIFSLGAVGALNVTGGWVSVLGLRVEDVALLRRVEIDAAIDMLTELATWRREQMVTVSKGAAGTAVTLLAALIAAMFEAGDSGLPRADIVVTAIVFAALLAALIQVVAARIQAIVLRDLDFLLGP
jgi:hypothetical protein